MGNRIIGIVTLIQVALADRMFDWLENPAIAAKCQRMVLKRVNSKWESTRIPSSCSIINNPEEEAVKVCKEAFPMLYVIGVRPIGQEMLAGPWCNSNHRDWEKPCHSKPKLAPVWECLVNNINTNEPTNYRKEISHPVVKKQIYNARGEYTGDVGSYNFEQGAKPLTTAAPTTTTTTTSTTTTSTTTTTTSTTTTTPTSTTTTMTTTTEKKSIATGPPALSVPPMCSFRHTERTKNETCKEAREWREDAITMCSTLKLTLHSFAPLSTCADNNDEYIGLQFVCCPFQDDAELAKRTDNNNDAPVAMAIKANNDIQVSRVEIQSSPSVAAAAIAVGAAVVLLLTALAVVTVRGRQRVRRERRLANQRTPLSPEERHLQRLQSTGYENPTYRFFEQRQ